MELQPKRLTKRPKKRYTQKDPTRKLLSKNALKSTFLKWQQRQLEIT